MALDYRKLTYSVAKVALAGAFGGPLGALAEAGSEVVDSLLGERSSSAQKSMDSLVRRIAADLTGFATGEGLDRGTVERALLNGRDVLARYGLSTADLVGLDLDPDRALAQVQQIATGWLKSLEPLDRDLCLRVVQITLSALLRDPALLPDVQQEFQRAVLARLADQGRIGDDVGRAVVRLGAFSMIADSTWPWLQELYPPSALLRANYGVVPFFGREDTLERLQEWSDHPRAIAVTVISGPGGMGKTRLMLQVCHRLRGQRWRAGFLHSAVSVVTADQLDALAEDAEGVLVVVDYAETRGDVVATLIEAALSTRARVRIVLLARSLGDWWVGLQYRSGRVGDLLSGPAASREDIAPVAPDLASREATHRAAAVAFGRALGIEAADTGVPDLRTPLFERVLFIHLSALARCLGEPGSSQKGLLGFALRREQMILDAAVRSADLAGLAGRPIRQAAALTTMAGSADSLSSAVQLLVQAPLLSDQPRAVLARVAVILHELHPSEKWLSGVQPDLLGEHLVSTALDEDPMLLGAFYAAG